MWIKQSFIGGFNVLRRVPIDALSHAELFEFDLLVFDKILENVTVPVAGSYDTNKAVANMLGNLRCVAVVTGSTRQLKIFYNTIQRLLVLCIN